MKIFNPFRRNARATDALPDAELIKQIVSSIITDRPDGFLKDKGLPDNWLSIECIFRVQGDSSDGFFADTYSWATTDSGARSRFATGNSTEPPLFRLYFQMRSKNQEWRRCTVHITRETLDDSPKFTLDFAQEAGDKPQ